jgi:hypothetical protein
VVPEYHQKPPVRRRLRKKRIKKKRKLQKTARVHRFDHEEGALVEQGEVSSCCFVVKRKDRHAVQGSSNVSCDAGFSRRLNQTPPMPSAPTPARFPGAEISNPLETPAAEARPEHNHGSPTPDKLQAEGLAADLDFYGTNEGLTLFDEKEETQHNADTEHAGSHSLSLSDGKQVAVHGEDDPKALLTDSRNKIMERMRRKLKEQEEYISELEDSVLELREKLLEAQKSK